MVLICLDLELVEIVQKAYFRMNSYVCQQGLRVWNWCSWKGRSQGGYFTGIPPGKKQPAFMNVFQ